MSNLLRNARPHLTYSITEKGSERRNMFQLDKSSVQSEVSGSQSQTTPEASSSMSKIPPKASSSKSRKTPKAMSTKATPPQTLASQPSESQGPVPQPFTSDGPVAQPSVTSPPLAVQPPTLQATSDLPQNAPTPTSALPASHTPTDPPPTVGPPSEEDMYLVATAIGVHQLLSQVATVSPVAQPFVAPSDIQPSQLSISPSELVVEPEVIITPPQSVPGHSRTPCEGSAFTPIDPVTTPVSSKLPVDASSVPTPKVLYRTRSPAIAPSQTPRRNSIDGAPEMIVDVIDEEEELTVNIRDYISIASDDDESHVSSSQRTADGSQELPRPPPTSQQVQASVGGTAESTNHSTCTLPQLDVDEEDLPTWMVKKGQWKYLASTAGGVAWQALLEVYISQERRLEFTEMVSDLAPLSLALGPNLLKGCETHDQGSASDYRRVLPVRPSAVSG